MIIKQLAIVKKKKKFAVQSAFVLYLILSLTDFFVVSILDVR